jgi:transcriptional regulator with XRE-family HTH domain
MSDYEDYLADICSGERDPYTNPYEPYSLRSYSSLDEDGEEDDEDVARAVAENIEYLADRKGLTMREVESGAGILPGYISRMLSAGSTPGVSNVLKIADYLDVPLEDIISGKFPRQNPRNEEFKKFIDKLIDDTRRGQLIWTAYQTDDGIFDKEKIGHSLGTLTGELRDEDGTIAVAHYDYIPEGLYEYFADEIYVTEETKNGRLFLICGNDGAEIKGTDLALAAPNGKGYKLASTIWLKSELTDKLIELIEEAQEAASSLRLDGEVQSVIGSFIGNVDEEELSPEELETEDSEEAAEEEEEIPF